MTKKCKVAYVLLTILSVLLSVGPLAAYTIAALVTSTLVVEKVALCATVLVVLVLSVVAWVNKTTMRSKVWVIMLGLYFCLDHFIGPLLVMAFTQITDEWFVSPAKAHYREKYHINKEIDKRQED